MSQRMGMAAAAAAWRRLQWLIELCWVNSTELRSQSISVAAWCNLPFRRVPSRTWLSTEMRWDEMSWPCKLFPGAGISRLIAIGYIMSISHRAAGGYSRTHIGQISLTESLRRWSTCTTRRRWVSSTEQCIELLSRRVVVAFAFSDIMAHSASADGIFVFCWQITT